MGNIFLLKTRKVRIKAPLCIIMEGVLYRKRFMTPWLKCIDEVGGKEALREVHDDPTRTHEGPRDLTGKILSMGI